MHDVLGLDVKKNNVPNIYKKNTKKNKYKC
jgi:hypothetical protein